MQNWNEIRERDHDLERFVRGGKEDIQAIRDRREQVTAGRCAGSAYCKVFVMRVGSDHSGSEGL